MARNVFINYRRSQNLKDAQLLENTLQNTFGASHVFLDTSKISGGKDWLHTLEAHVDASDAMVALIGKNWAGAVDETGARRLDNPDDFVRFEIARALLRKIPVLPVLVDGAAMPTAAELPRSLLPLLFQQAMLLRAESFQDDAAKIAERLKDLIAETGGAKRSGWIIAAAALTCLIAGIAVGPAIQSRLGLLPAATDMGLRAPLEAAQQKIQETQTALEQANSQTAQADRRAKDAEAQGEHAKAELAAAVAAKANAVRQAQDAQASLAAAQTDAKAAAQRTRDAEADAANARAALQKAQLATDACASKSDNAAAVQARAAEPTAVAFHDNITLRKGQAKQYDEIGVRLSIASVRSRHVQAFVNQEIFDLAFGERKVFHIRDLACEIELMDTNVDELNARMAITCKR